MTIGYIVTRPGGGVRTGCVAEVREATNGGRAPYVDRRVARFFGRTFRDVFAAAERFCVREYGAVSDDPLEVAA